MFAQFLAGSSHCLSFVSRGEHRPPARTCRNLLETCCRLLAALLSACCTCGCGFPPASTNDGAQNALA
eukprot:5421346-Alexandrium_andersonii.AAC.1